MIFGAFSMEIRGEDLEEFSLRFCWGIHTWVPRDSFLGDPPSQICGKSLRFGGFLLNLRWCVLEGWLSIALDLVSFEAWHLSHGMPMRYSLYPQSFTWIRGVDREIGWREICVLLAALFFPRLQTYTGMSSALHRSDRCWSSWGFPLGNSAGVLGLSKDSCCSSLV